MNPYAKYKEKSVLSMSGAELILLLYDEADKRLAKAGYALDEKDYTLFDSSLTRASEIVQYLTQILNMDYPISRELKRIYHYVVYDISRLKAARERLRNEVSRIRQILAELRDAFEQAGRKTGVAPIVINAGVLG